MSNEEDKKKSKFKDINKKGDSELKILRRKLLAGFFIILGIFLLFTFYNLLSSFSNHSTDIIDLENEGLSDQIKSISNQTESFKLKGNSSYCYILKPSSNLSSPYLQIKTYNQEDRCQGEVLDRRTFETNKPVEIDGGSCFCGNCSIRTNSKENYWELNTESCR